MPLQATSGAASQDGFGGNGVPIIPNYIEEVFSTYLYTGNNTTLPIVNGIDLSTKGGMFWTKSRTNVTNHAIYDTTRGVNFVLRTNSTIASTDVTGDLTSFNTDGYTIGTPTATNDLNFNSNGKFVSWTFRKQPKFFDIVTWTGNGPVTHNLGTTPAFWVYKDLGVTSDWFTLARKSDGTYEALYLNKTDATAFTGADAAAVGLTATTFDPSLVFGSAAGRNYVAYAFAHNAGGFGLTGTDNVISCGSYTGNGSASGPTISLGYEPQWIMVKRATGGTGNWVMIDSMRGFVNSISTTNTDSYLVANTTAAESTWGDFTGSENAITPLATGFQIVTSTATLNNSSDTYIYIVIRKGPMKVPTDPTKVFLPTARTGNASLTTINSGFATDVVFARRRDTLDNTNESVFADRLRGKGTLSTTLTDAEYNGGATSGINAYTNTGVVLGINNNPIYAFNFNTLPYVLYQFQRAPNFMDEVCWSGTGTNVVTHNLTVPPELIIEKTRTLGNAFANWWTWRPNTGGDWGILNGTSVFNTGSGNLTATSTTFEPLVDTAGQKYVAYLFATCAGVSKVGSYTGNGTTQTINCGFGAGGARFVLIKRTDSTGGWYVYDTARGMTVLTDPYLFLNTNAAEVATLGSVTTVSTGFALNSTILADINVSSGTYIFLAIA